jgi:hypothetical protein
MENSASRSNLAKTIPDQIQVCNSLHYKLSPNELKIGGLAHNDLQSSPVKFQVHWIPFGTLDHYQTPSAET